MPLGTRKICVVGFQKTGTSSVAAALTRIGYNVGSVFGAINAVLDPKSADASQIVSDIAVREAAKFDVVQDSPSAFVFDTYDRAFPGSKFILTSRPVEAWLKSYAGYFQDKNNPLREWMYGVDKFEGNAQRYSEVYLAQNDKIRTYFRNRPQDFLEMDLAKGQGWYELVNLIGPDMLPGFPHQNAADPTSWKYRAKRLLGRHRQR